MTNDVASPAETSAPSSIGPSPGEGSPKGPTLLERVRGASLFSIASVGVAVITQLAIPRVLLATWGDSGYAFAVAVQGFMAYVSVADAGVLLYLSRSLAILHAAGDTTAALGLTRGGLRAFAVLATVGAAIVFAAFLLSGRPIWHSLALSCGVSPGLAVLAALGQVVSGGTSLALGGWSSAVDQGRGRYARVPAFGLARAILTTGAMLGLAEWAVGPGTTLILLSGLIVVFEGSRFALALRAEPPLRAVEPQPTRHILRDARGSLLFYLATTTQSGLQPYVAAALSASVVSVAVPARTLANSARMVLSAAVNVLWVPIAARLFELKDADERLRFWRRNSPVLSTVHVAGILILLGLAPLVVPHWLPSKSAAILGLLPFYCVEQGAYVAAIPAIVLMQATGRFGTLGAVTLAAATATVAGTVVLIPRFGATGFAAASAVSTLLILAPIVLALEWHYWRSNGVSATAVLLPRVASALLVAACAIPYSRHPFHAVALLAALFGCLGVYSIRSRRIPDRVAALGSDR